MTKKVLKKIIKNWVEYFLPEWWGWGGWVDENEVNALIDLKIWDYDSVFSIESWLYKILNWIDEEDELGLTAWETWNDIVSSSSSMNKISHSYAVMSVIASSDYALDILKDSSTAINEILECWNSISILVDSEKWVNMLVNNSDIFEEVLWNQVSKDAIFNSDKWFLWILNNNTDISLLLDDSTAFEDLLKSNHNSKIWEQFFNNQDIITTLIASPNTYFTIISNNKNALEWLINSNNWSSVADNYDCINLLLSNSESANYIMNLSSSESLYKDSPLRAIINNNLLEQYITKDDFAFNSIMEFDVNCISSTTFRISISWSYNWKYSIDWANRQNLSWSASNSYLNIAMGSTWNHKLVIKPNTYAMNWAWAIWNRWQGDYWWYNSYQIAFTIRNLPIYAFMSSNSLWNSFMSYRFYGCKTLIWIDEVRFPDSITSIGTNYFYYTFYQSNIKRIWWSLLPKNITSIPNGFMYYCFSQSQIENINFKMDLSKVTNIWTYFLYYAFEKCSKITDILSIELPNCAWVWDYFMTYTYINCTWIVNATNKLNLWAVKTVWTSFMQSIFQNCTNLVKLPSGFTLWWISTSIWGYFLYYSFYGCSSLASLPSWFRLPPVSNSSYYCYYTWANCSSLTATAPTENIKFKYNASYCFSWSWITPVSPTTNQSVAIHME